MTQNPKQLFFSRKKEISKEKQYYNKFILKKSIDFDKDQCIIVTVYYY